MCALVGHVQVTFLEGRLDRLPAGNLALAAHDVLVNGDAELVDQVGPITLDEPGRIFAEVLARFGDEVAQAAEHLVTHCVRQAGNAAVGALGVAAVGGDGPPRHFGDARVEIFHTVGGLALEAQVEGHVVDACAEVVDFLNRHADVARQLFCRPLHAVAEADGLDLGGAANGPADHRHRVDVLEEGHVGADLLHVAAHVEQHGNGAQTAHDAADAQRVGNGLVQAIALGNLEVGHCARFIAAHLNHADGIVRPVERLPPIQRGFDFGLCAKEIGDSVRHNFRRAQAFLVDVEQRQGGRLQFGETENIADQILGKDGAACADERNFRHGVVILRQNSVCHNRMDGFPQCGSAATKEYCPQRIPVCAARSTAAGRTRRPAPAA